MPAPKKTQATRRVQAPRRTPWAKKLKESLAKLQMKGEKRPETFERILHTFEVIATALEGLRPELRREGEELGAAVARLVQITNQHVASAAVSQAVFSILQRESRSGENVVECLEKLVAARRQAPKGPFLVTLRSKKGDEILERVDGEWSSATSYPDGPWAKAVFEHGPDSVEFWIRQAVRLSFDYRENEEDVRPPADAPVRAPTALQ